MRPPVPLFGPVTKAKAGADENTVAGFKPEAPLQPAFPADADDADDNHGYILSAASAPDAAAAMDCHAQSAEEAQT